MTGTFCWRETLTFWHNFHLSSTKKGGESLVPEISRVVTHHPSYNLNPDTRFLARKIKRFNSHSCFNMGGSSCLDFSHHLTWWTILLIFDATMRWVVLPIPWHWSQRFWGVNFSTKIAIQNIGTVLYYFFLTGFFKQGQNLSIFFPKYQVGRGCVFFEMFPISLNRRLIF